MKEMIAKVITSIVVATACTVASFTAIAASPSPSLLDFTIDNSTAALQRGAELVQGKCLLCHDLKYVKYRHLADIGFTEAQLTLLRGESGLEDAVLSMMDSDARQEMLGMVPPDLTLITKARRGGERYIYSFLLGFAETAEGTATNRYFPGTRMSDPLGISYVTDEGERQVIYQQAADIVAFLSWAADPHATERKTIGYYVIAYLVLLTVLLYFMKRRIWRRLDDE